MGGGGEGGQYQDSVGGLLHLLLSFPPSRDDSGEGCPSLILSADGEVNAARDAILPRRTSNLSPDAT
jgi:hypothetical protein